ncbi:hypothetical protein B9Z55_017468 [Caenorhabditis nigoni]|nr:hypothetical protein B9Z55_017468 [Caenorhabditis nigoni]
MSLSYFILNGFQLNPDYYECNTTLRPVGLRREFWGSYFFWTGILIFVLYLICFIAIATHDLMKTPAYKIMFVLGVYDLSSVFMDSIVTGILGFFGVAFCDCPRFIFVMGAIGYGSWMGCCITSLILAVIRICDVRPKLKIRKLYVGRRIYFFVGLCWVYGICAALFTKPITFSSFYMSWFFDPGLGKDPKLYRNIYHFFNNCSMAIGTVSLYGYLAYIFLNKTGDFNATQLSRYQTRVLFQAFMFCIFHLISSIMYTYMQYVSAPEFFILIGQIAWQFGSGSVCMVYLTLNRSIRKAVFQKIYPQILVKVGQAPVQGSSDSRAMELSAVQVG